MCQFSSTLFLVLEHLTLAYAIGYGDLQTSSPLPPPPSLAHTNTPVPLYPDKRESKSGLLFLAREGEDDILMNNHASPPVFGFYYDTW